MSAKTMFYAFAVVAAASAVVSSAATLPLQDVDDLTSPAMLESFDEMHMPPMESVYITKEGPDKPVKITTSKIEIINGHRVQVNETTISGGKHHSYFHFKEIHGLDKQISDDKLISTSADDSETQKMEANQI